MVHAYYLIGKRIIVQEQNGQHRAEYGKEIVKNLSDELSAKYGKGYSTQSLYNFRLFYEKFSEPKNFSTVWRNLTWSHYKLIMRVTSKTARDWYCDESSRLDWDTRTLQRNIGTQYYERLIPSQINTIDNKSLSYAVRRNSSSGERFWTDDESRNTESMEKL